MQPATANDTPVTLSTTAEGTPSIAVEMPVDPMSLNYRREQRIRKVPFRSAEKGPIRYQRLPVCHHKFVPGAEPRHRNCESCWFAFFQIHGEIVQAADEVHSKYGISGLAQLRGQKFAQNFTKFMATVAVWKKAMEEAKEKNDTTQESAGDAGGSGGDAAVEPQSGELSGPEAVQ